MGLEMSAINTFIAGDTVGDRYDIYKMNYLDHIEYLKVEDMLLFNIKKSVEPKLKAELTTKRLMGLVKEMNHPNIIRPHYFTQDDQFYVVRTYYDDYYGFASRLNIQRELQKVYRDIEIGENQIVFWMKQLLEALACLHRHNILHKFIIPETMLFLKEQLKLFVPSRSTVLEDDEETVFEESTWYKCPEHMRYKKIGLKYDIWSLGWLLYHLCSLENSRDLLNTIEDFNVWDKPSIPRYYSRNLDRIFKRMTQLDPDLRPSAEELLEEPLFKNNFNNYYQ